MKKAKLELTPEQKQELNRLAQMPDELIDTKDAPVVLDWSRARRGMFLKPEPAPGAANNAD